MEEYIEKMQKHYDKMQKYYDKIDDLRHTIWRLVAEARAEGRPVSPECYDAEKELDRVCKNLRAYCHRHGIYCPSNI